MLAYHDAGFTTWDLADHYGPAEDFIGQFKQQLTNERGADAWRSVQAFTKWVPRPDCLKADAPVIATAPAPAPAPAVTMTPAAAPAVQVPVDAGF